MFLKLINRSFSAKATFYVLLCTFVLFILTFAMFYHFSAEAVEKDARQNAQNLLKVTILKIERILGEAGKVSENLAWIVQKADMPPDQYYMTTKNVILNNSDIYGCAIAFEPNYYPEKGYFYSPYSYRADTGVVSLQLGNAEYDYFCMDWYQIPKLLKKNYWTEPYFDSGGGQTLMSTYSTPIFDKEKKNVIGISTIDISLDWLTDLIDQTAIYEGGYAFVIGRGGSYIVHPQKEKILNESVFTASESLKDTTLLSACYDMVEGREGSAVIQNESGISTVFYAPVYNGWSVAIVCPRNEVFAPLYKMRDKVLWVGVIGLLVLMLICRIVVEKLSSPLRKFAVSARSIASGNFNVELPNISSEDELKELRDSFSYMQTELSQYIKHLSETTAAKEKIESELRIAREIQMGMIPKIFPPFPNRPDIDLYAILKPAKEVGGDLYDFFLNGDELYFVIGDVSGKGVPASLLMAVTRTLLRSIAFHYDTPSSTVNALNNVLADENESNMFVTFFMGILNMKTGKLRYCNAGHNPFVLIEPGKGASYFHVIPNLPIGLMKDFDYKEQEYDVPTGSTFLLYTDGITEAEDASKKQFGEAQLLTACQQGAQDKSQDLIERILSSVASHVNGAVASDDLTLLALHYNQNANVEQLQEKVMIDSNRNIKKLSIHNNVEEMAALEPFIEDFVQEFKLPEIMIMSLNLVLEEAVVNCVHYAYPKELGKMITVEAERQDDNLVLTIRDLGVPFDPTLKEDPDITSSVEDRKIGGLGIFLVKQVMDDVQYQRINDENVLILKKKIINEL